MKTADTYELANAGKADFEWTYNRLDPRSYFKALGALDYAIPERAAPVFRRVIDACATARHSDCLNVIDIGCSYGINAAVLKYGCKMSDLRSHYSELNGTTPPHEVMEADRKLFTDSTTKCDLHITGIDRAQFAASYAFWAGLLDDAIPENLEERDPSPQAAKTIARCDLVISTGVVGYVTERTFERILKCQPKGEMPWIASFVLRMFDFAPVQKMLSTYGYETEQLSGRFFKQRRFASAAEQAHVEKLLEDKGLDTDGLESEGHYLAEFFLSRPKADALAAPLSSIVPR